eukprot:GHVR01008867.1.p1 GENE.GHVR01008867.1~~GHVR01008867.1.p1  ORF type:complete len:107 (+),score=25.57 GHVR01008867.1:46-366(+)
MSTEDTAKVSTEAEGVVVSQTEGVGLVTDVTDQQTAQGKLLYLPVYEIVTRQRQHNGLRHHDYHRYRQYCTRRLDRVRTVVGFKHGRHRYTHKTIPLDITDIRLYL